MTQDMLSGIPEDPLDSPSSEIPVKSPRHGCWRCGCLGVGIPVVLLLLLVGWIAAVQTHTFEKIGLVRPPEDRYLGGAPNLAAAEALKAELVKTGFSAAGLEVAVLPVKGQAYNLAVVVLDASQGFKGNAGADLLLESFRRLAESSLVDQYHIERVAAHYYNVEGVKLVSLTSTTQDIRRYIKGQISKQEFLKAIEGAVDYSSILGGMR